MADFTGAFFDATFSANPADAVTGAPFQAGVLSFPADAVVGALWIVVTTGPTPVPPTITYVTPPGQVPQNGSIVFDITDVDSGYTAFIFARMQDASQEVVFDGALFAAYYATSSRVAIANGYRYTVRRHGGWPSDFTIRANAIDTTGADLV